MIIFSYFSAALINLTASKLRSLLAVLGILVGTAAVVALISCGELATEKALEQFKTLGTDLLAVSFFQQTAGKAGNDNNESMLSFWRNLPHYIPSICRIAPYSSTYQVLSFGGKNLNGTIIGADDELANIIHIELAQGNFVSFVQTFEHFCVIGQDIAKQIQLITLDNPIGKQINIGKLPYTIIGIAKKWQENGFFHEDINRGIIIPLPGITVINKNSKVRHAVLQLKENSSIDNIIEEIKARLHKENPKLSIFTRSAKQIIISMQKQGQTFTLLLAVIGSISLLVGGIGIMNIMLVAVNERKKEIGIRKAVGANNKEIKRLFLIESMMLSLLGGIIGVVIGIIFTWLVAYFSQWPFTIFILPICVGFFVSVATGIFFGFYPANKAAQLEPVFSLRCE